MQQVRGSMSLVRERFQWGSYGFVTGIILGLILGWIFHGVISRIFWILVVLVPLIFAFLVWQRLTNRRRRDDAVETRSFVVETRSDEREGR